jgi:hypothetical protein
MQYKPAFVCYYCSFQTDIQEDYERYVVLTHPRKPCYPSMADLSARNAKGKQGLEAKGNQASVNDS